MCTIDRTCDICADWSAAQWEHFVKKHSYIDRKKPSRLQALFHLRRWLLPARNSFWSFAPWDFFLFSFPPFRWSGEEGGWSRDAPGVVSRRASSPPAGSRSSERGGSAPASLAPAGASEGGVARMQRTSLARSASSVVSPHSSPHARIERDFGGPLPRVILSWFPIFGSRSTGG